MKLFLVSLVAACALMLALAASAGARTDGHFPEGVFPPGADVACPGLLTTPAVATGSDIGLANKADLYADVCLGAP